MIIYKYISMRDIANIGYFYENNENYDIVNIMYNI
jgi:hypothetical protein